MKIRMEDNYRSFYTLEMLDQAKAVIEMEKEDEMSIREYAKMAANEILKNTNDYCVSIIQAEAHTAGNCRIWNQYGEGTGTMDVWISGIAETSAGFLRFGAYLTDIWQTGAVPYRDRTWHQYYSKADLK